MVCVPALSAEVVKVALPLTRERKPIPLSPSLMATVLVGTPEPGTLARTIVVKVTDWPTWIEVALLQHGVVAALVQEESEGIGIRDHHIRRTVVVKVPHHEGA